MTNYPRDEFDRVPEFNTRVGSHHANGWAQAAATDSRGGKFRWVALAAVAALLIGAVSYFFFGPNAQGQLIGASPTASPSATQSAAADSSTSTPSPTPSPSSTIDEADVMYDQMVGIYNGSGLAGVAGDAGDLLASNEFSRTYTDDWVRVDDFSAVYYNAPMYRSTAQKIAELLSIEDVYQTTNIPNRLTVVIGQDNPVQSASAPADAPEATAESETE